MSKSRRYYTAPVPKMPLGLIELMDGLARDVLKNNPPDIYEFCADHMKKLLQIRDESKKPSSTAKRSLTLEQKISLAKKFIRERAALRREKYDKYVQDYSQSEGNKETENGVAIEAEQYNKDNVIKIDQIDLAGNSEHEIVAKDVKNVNNSLQETDEITITEDTAILENEHDNNLEGIDKRETLLKPNISECIGDENKVTEDIISKTNECESSVENLINNDNISESTSQSDLEDLDASKISLKTEEIKEKNDNSNDKIEVTDSLDSNKKEVVNLAPSPEDKEDDTIESCNQTDEINTVEELNITVTYNSDINGQTDNATPNNEINKNEANSSQKSVIILAEDGNDIKNGHLSNEENELSKKSPTIIDANSDDDKRNYQELVSEVNNTSMDLETAAITIQKVFRSFLFRNKTLSTDEATNVDINLLIEDKEQKGISDVQSGNGYTDRRCLGLSRIDTVLQTVNEEKSLSLSTDDSSTLSSAATIIQAHVRGFLVRNKFNFNKANSSTSGFDSDGHSTASFEVDNDGRKNKTILNIHIVPEGGHYMSRDESMLTSMDLSVDGSPPNSTNLHPLSHDTSERRKQLKREDAIQSVSPPSNNSGKQSVEVDSVKEILGQSSQPQNQIESIDVLNVNMEDVLNKNASKDNLTGLAHESIKIETSDSSLPSLTSDEMDVVTPFAATDSDNDSRILHSGEFHDVVLPTKVTRTDTSVVRGE